MLNFARILFCILITSSLYSQATEIEGIVNEYAKVLSFSTESCQSRITVDTADFFSIGDRVLIIQMKGAEITTSNTENFGDILDMKSAGNYEFASVANIDGNQITLNETLGRNYEPDHQVQLIKVAVYQDAVVTDVLTARAWDGDKGGVLALEVENELRIEANIRVSGLGFRGGIEATDTYTVDPAQDCGLMGYALSADGANGGQKGEGITQSMDTYEVGRGPLATGGGGGNSHNAGGGGGSNAGEGGMGGNEWSSCPNPQAVGGLGGNGLTPDQLEGRLLMGSGGGAGESNGQQGTNGGNGGGILVIMAGSITSDINRSLSANGSSVLEDAGPDGAGGGGGGGTILLSVAGSITDLVVAEVVGGNGGDNANLSSCVGPGGGGGGGTMFFAGNTPNIPVDLMLGFAGAFTSPDISLCTNTTYGALNGVNGMSFSEVDIFIAEPPVSMADCDEYAIPNIFTPNGDGINDVFGVFFSGNIEVLNLRVYNRWGTLVHDSPQRWDGRYKGEPHPSDVLIYQAVIETSEGVEEVKGEVVLLR